MARQDDLNSVFANEMTTLKAKLELAIDALNAVDRALSPALERLAGMDPNFAALQKDYRAAMSRLRKEGLSVKHDAPAQTECPQCHSKIRVLGNQGDRCDWCGYVFPLRCPSCQRELKNIEGKRGDTCLWCRYEF